MAERYAIQSGNWSNTATWNGGTLPLSGDRVFANGFTLTIDQSLQVISLHTDVGAIAVAGGRFRALSGGHAVNADSIAGSSTCLEVSSNCTQNGNSMGGYASNANGSLIQSGGTQNGNSAGGSVGNAHGSVVQNGGIQNGNSTGGSASNSHGSFLISGGIQNGNSTGGSASNSHGSLVVSGGIQNGNSTGGSVGNSEGSRVQGGGIQNGNSTGGPANNAFGSNVSSGGLIVSTGIINSAFASGLRLGNDGTVILRGPDASLIDISASPGRFLIGNQNHPFINPAVVAAVARRSFIAGGFTA